MKKRIILFLVLFMSSVALKSQTIMNLHQNNGTVVQIPVNTIDSITYTVINIENLPTLTTLPITNLSSSTATSGGNITNDGGTPIIARGLVLSTVPNPTIADYFTNEGSGIGSFSSNLIELTPNTSIYLRAYATNSAGTAYGNELSFTTIVINPGIEVTFDGYTYSSVHLGNGQEWMTENLKTVVYANGDSIPNVTNPNQWSLLSTGAWVHYNNDSQFENPHGKLYNWFTVVDPRNVCPTGWHVPTDVEWSILINYLEPNADGGDIPNTAGGRMKSTGTQYWLTPNTDATNESGFSGLPGGVRNYNGTFENIGVDGLWWSSTEFVTNYAWNRYLSYGDGNISRSGNDKTIGFSVRCLKD
jgi:uncharacterized protein (TIGR02145 family)